MRAVARMLRGCCFNFYKSHKIEVAIRVPLVLLVSLTIIFQSGADVARQVVLLRLTLVKIHFKVGLQLSSQVT